MADRNYIANKPGITEKVKNNRAIFIFFTFLKCFSVFVRKRLRMDVITSH